MSVLTVINEAFLALNQSRAGSVLGQAEAAEEALHVTSAAPEPAPIESAE